MLNRFSSRSSRSVGLGLLSLLAATSLVVSGCSDDRQIGGEGGSSAQTGTASTGTGTMKGTQGGGTLVPGDGKTAPASAVVQVVWGVTSKNPDYNYVFGEGEVSKGTYDLSLAEPPEDALNTNGIGVGILVLLPEGGAFPEGKLADDKVLGAQAIGASGTYAIIYKKAGATGNAWSGPFKEGYGCAKGVPAAPGESFDSFEPIECSKVVITVDAIGNIKFTNWT